MLSSSLNGIIEAPTSFDAVHVYMPESLAMVGSIVRTLVTANTLPLVVAYSLSSVSVTSTRDRISVGLVSSELALLRLKSPINQLMTGAGIPVELQVNVAESDWFTVSSGEGTRNWISEITAKHTK